MNYKSSVPSSKFRVVRREARQPSDKEKNFSGRRENRRHCFPLKRSTIRVIETRRERIGSLPEPFKLEPRGASETEVKGVGEQWNEIGKQTVTLPAAGSPLAFLATRPALITPTPTKISRY